MSPDNTEFDSAISEFAFGEHEALYRESHRQSGNPAYYSRKNRVGC